MSNKKFALGKPNEVVKDTDITFGKGDWLLKWTPTAPDDETGFALYTPGDFDAQIGGGPLGGMLLAAVFFMLEHGDGSFPKELISRANELAKEQREREQNAPDTPRRTLN